MCKPEKQKLYIHFEGKKVDVQNWRRYHPGGSKVLKIFQDRDVTAQFHATHSDEAIEMVRKRADKSKVEAPVPSKQDQLYVELLNSFKKRGYFNCDVWVVMENILKNAVILLPYFYALYCVYNDQSPWIACFCNAWAMYYAGWVGHDYSHHQWGPNSSTADANLCDMMSCLHGAFIRGNGGLWWKRRHNTHHVVTNEIGNDPDIKTNPLLIFFENHKLYWFNRYQHIYYVPLLSLLNFYWHIESWVVDLIHAIGRSNIREAKIAMQDIFGLVYFDVVFVIWGMQQGFTYPMVSMWISGLGTALVVFATHYAEEHLPKDHDYSFIVQTAMTSRNIKGFFGETWFWNILTNNLSLQKEHHLFPRMPNVYLRTIVPEVRSLIESYGVEYSEDNIVQCAINAMTMLKRTGNSEGIHCGAGF